MNRLFRWLSPNVKLNVIDVGANISQFSKQLKGYFPDTDIIMFEANPNCEPHLSLLNISYEMVALGASSDSSNLFVENSNKVATGASLYIENTEWYTTDNCYSITVPVRPLDDYVPFNNQRIHLLKIDTQGSEYDIIIGSVETLTRVERILVEVSLLEYNKGAPQLESVLNLLESNGFILEDIIETHRSVHLVNNAIFQIDLLFKNTQLN